MLTRMIRSASALLTGRSAWNEVCEVRITVGRTFIGHPVSPGYFTLLLQRNLDGRRRVRIVDMFNLIEYDVKSTLSYHEAKIWVRTGTARSLDQFITRWSPADKTTPDAPQAVTTSA